LTETQVDGHCQGGTPAGCASSVRRTGVVRAFY